MRYVIIVLGIFLLVGCSSLSKEKYDKIKVGMTYSQVSELLGKAKHCDALAGVSDCMWGDEQHYIKVKFVTDKVIFMNSQGLK
jgi:uncharacterized protein YceK